MAATPGRRIDWKIDPYFALGMLAVLVLGTGYLWQRAHAEPAFAHTPLPAALTARLEGLGLAYRTGRPAAPVKVVEVFDYECPACAAAHRATWPMLKRHLQDGTVSYAVYDVPLPQHARAVPASVVATCVAAGHAEQLWEYRHRVLATQALWDAEPDPAAYFLRTAGDAGADTAAVRACVAARGAERARQLSDGWNTAQASGVRSIPAFEVNGRPVRWDLLETEVEKLLAAR